MSIQQEIKSRCRVISAANPYGEVREALDDMKIYRIS